MGEAVLKLAADNFSFKWEAQPGPQAAFLSCNIYEVTYGGAAGGGKSESLLVDYLRDVKQWGKAWKGVLFRRSYPQLEDLINRSIEVYPAVFPGAVYHEQKKTWRFPSGAAFKFRSLDRRADCMAYQGHGYTWIGFDELSHWASDYEYEFMKMRCRSAVAGVPKRIRSSANPGFVGHVWVKKYFIDNGPYIVVRNNQNLLRTFIPATLEDNKILQKNDPQYKARLMSIRDPMLRKALLHGDWDVVAGAFFGDIFTRNKSGQPWHVIKPFIPPANWYTDRSMDWGSSRPYTAQYWTESNGETLPDGRRYPKGALILFHEFYGIKKRPDGEFEDNVGVQWPAERIALLMKTVELRWKKLTGVVVRPGPADTDIFERQDNHCINDNFAIKGVIWDKANKGPNSRQTGWQLLREKLAPENEDKPMIYVTANCIHWLRTVPTLIRSDRDWEDVADNQEDHAGDATRYRLLAKKRFITTGQKYWK